MRKTISLTARFTAGKVDEFPQRVTYRLMRSWNAEAKNERLFLFLLSGFQRQPYHRHQLSRALIKTNLRTDANQLTSRFPYSSSGRRRKFIRNEYANLRNANKLQLKRERNFWNFRFTFFFFFFHLISNFWRTAAGERKLFVGEKKNSSLFCSEKECRVSNWK